MSKFNTAYGKRKPFSISFPEQGMTEQHHKQDCDINYILKKYDRTGLITHVNTATAQYGDYTEVNEYQESLNMVIAAQASFMELPSEIRKRFGNDPGSFFEFATNPENADEMVKMGLANPIPQSAEEAKPPKSEAKAEEAKAEA